LTQFILYAAYVLLHCIIKPGPWQQGQRGITFWPSLGELRLGVTEPNAALAETGTAPLTQ